MQGVSMLEKIANGTASAYLISTVVVSIIPLIACAEGIIVFFDAPWWLGGVICVLFFLYCPKNIMYILTYPLIYIGATQGWHWEWWQAIGLFILPYLPSLIAVPFLALSQPK